MSINEKQVVFDCLAKTLKVRKKHNADTSKPICIYDIVEQAGVEIRFQEGIPSMEGIYSKSPGPVIIINSERPPGRQSYNCAHEFGHHIFNHGMCYDEITDNRNYSKNTYKEFQADCFAGFLLMPKIALHKAFNDRKWKISEAKPSQIYILSKYFGVGYRTLTTHLSNSLRIISESHKTSLLKHTPKAIKEEFLNFKTNSNLIIVDSNWKYKAIDIQVDDLIVANNDIDFEGGSIINLQENSAFNIFKGVLPGISRIYSTHSEWAAFVRVSRKDYSGLSRYRHLEEIKE